MHAEVWRQERFHEVTSGAAISRHHEAGQRAAGARLLRCYRTLAKTGAHLLDSLFCGEAPRQWSHYPADDAIDDRHGYQWFYHSHAPADRAGSTEHGHIHVFARPTAWAPWADAAGEPEFARVLDMAGRQASTRHLLCIGLDAKGVPQSLFTVNSWVTGDAMMSEASTVRMIAGLRLSTGHALIDEVIVAITRLYRLQIDGLMQQRDATLIDRARLGPGTLDDESMEVLSELRINPDQQLAAHR